MSNTVEFTFKNIYFRLKKKLKLTNYLNKIPTFCRVYSVRKFKLYITIFNAF